MARKFGRELLRLRKERRLSQREIGQLLGGYTPRRIYDWETLSAAHPNSRPPEYPDIILGALETMPVLKSKRGTPEREAEMTIYCKGFLTIRAAKLLQGALDLVAGLDVDDEVREALVAQLASAASGIKRFTEKGFRD